MQRRWTALVPALALVVMAACDQGSTGPRTAGNTQFLLSQVGGSGAAASVITLDDGHGGMHGNPNSVPLADIKSIDVRVTGIAVLPVGNDSVKDDQWIKLNAVKPTLLDLLALPTKADSGLKIVRGTLPAGTYDHLRLLFDSASITFAQNATVGRDNHTRTFKADSTYPLVIGGIGMPPDSVSDNDRDDEAANHFGIFVPGTTFTVAKDTTTTISLVFNAGESVKRVILTSKGLRLAPVLLAARHEDADSDSHGGHHD